MSSSEHTPPMSRLPLNFGLCFGRLKPTVNRLRAQPQLLAKYGVNIKEQLKNGIIGEVKDYQQFNAGNLSLPQLVHYLLHHAVTTPEKPTTKVRMVFGEDSNQ